jgi:hypothetical protein
MAAEYILSTDKLQSGFRAKYNLSVAEIIISFVDNGDGTVTANLFGGGTLTMDLTTSFFTKAEVVSLINGIAPPIIDRVEFTETADLTLGTIDLSAETIPAFPVYKFYPTAGGVPQPGDYDPDTQIVSGLTPGVEYLCVFIG